MDIQAILEDIDRQFAQLRQVRELLASIVQPAQEYSKRPGRPTGSGKKKTEANAPSSTRAPKTTKRTLSTEGKERIAAAQKKRWAAQKQAQEPATRKYGVKPKPARKKTALAKQKAVASETPETTEAGRADA